MKNIVIKFIAAVALLTAAIFMIGTFKNDISGEFDVAKASYDVDAVYLKNDIEVATLSDAMDFAIVSPNANKNTDSFQGLYFCLLIDGNTNEVIAAKNPHYRIYPASMTKLMTACVVLDYIEKGKISLDDIVTLDKNYYINVDGAGTSELTRGCKISVNDLIHGLLIESNNFYGLILADYIAGDVDKFVDMMNKRSIAIGATNTHFVNPHGIDNPEHYTSAYDMYLITKEANKYKLVNDICKLPKYSYYYTDSYGTNIDKDALATNLFLHNKATLPAGFEIEVWKTGTTTGAGNCITMCVSKGENIYYLCIGGSCSRKDLYNNIAKVLCLIK